MKNLVLKQQDNFQEETNYEEQLASGDYLKVRGLYKQFDDGKVAVNNLNLNLYKNEIFALLGHNGAGKSTTISILAGLYSATEGIAEYKKKNIFQNMDEFRKKVGICPQHDILFDQLTVREHLELFCIFKGIDDPVKIENEIVKIIEQIDIEDIQNKEANTLSGGQKRKLSIGIALVGGSEVVFLDEPSSGMDITSRRRLWDILKKNINDRIIILTTHYMEEAAVLGNRVGIISDGELQCSGTPLYLINKYGEYFNLNVQLTPDTDIEKIQSFIKGNFENVTFDVFTEEMACQIIKSPKINLKDFFHEFDKQIKDFAVKSYSVSMPTLEDVFLTVANNEHKKHSKFRYKILDKDQNKIEITLKDQELNDKYDIIYTYNREQEEKISSFAKFNIDIKYLLMKRWFQIIRDFKTFLFEILCPILLVIVGLGVGKVDFLAPSPRVEMSIKNLENQFPMVNKIPIHPSLSDMDTSFLSQYQTPNFNYKFIDWDSEGGNVFNSLVKYNKYLQSMNNTKQLGNYLITHLNKATHNYEFILVANLYSKDSLVMYINEMLTNIVRMASGVNDISINVRVIYKNSGME